MKKLLTFLFVLSPFFLASQNHDHVWVFGYNSPTGELDRGGCVLDFNYEPPLAYEQERDMNLDVTVASTCDSTGSLELYTNGIYLANFEHEMIENGDSLNPGQIADEWAPHGYPVFQSALALESPDNQGFFNIFHLKIEYHNTLSLAVSTLYRTKVDMNANNGLGKVLSKNEELMIDGVFGTLSAVKHANGRDWWVVVSDALANNYHLLLLSPEGAEKFSEQSLLPEISTYTSGTIVFSPDGSKMARYEVGLEKLMVYGFNRCQGLFELQKTILVPDANLGGGISFSQNSEYLYATTTSHIFQFDLTSPDIPASIDTVAIYDGAVSSFPTTFFASQLGPDGRIYINTTNNTDILHVINYPDKKGDACQVVQGGVQLPTRNRFTSQHFPNYRLGPLDGSPCDTLGLDNLPIAKFRYEQDTLDYLQVEFTDLSYYEPATWQWDFGDNTTSQDTSPVHVFSQPSSYEACLTVGNVNGEHTFCRTLELGTVSSVEAAQGVSINVFPNPAREGVNITFTNYLPRDARIVLFDAVGQRHKVQALQTGWNTLFLEGLQAGLYFYEIREGEVLLKSGKLVKVE